MMLAQVLVGGSLMALVSAGMSQTMVATYKGAAKSQLRSQADTAFRLVQKHIDNGSSPTEVNGCEVTNIGAYGEEEEFTRRVDLKCATPGGKLSITPSRLVVCEPCSKQAAAEPPTTEEPTTTEETT